MKKNKNYACRTSFKNITGKKSKKSKIYCKKIPSGTIAVSHYKRYKNAFIFSVAAPNKKEALKKARRVVAGEYIPQ